MLPPLDDEIRTSLRTRTAGGGPAAPASASSSEAPPYLANQRQMWAPLL